MADSVFTKIINGEFPSYKIHEDEWTYSFLTKESIQLGHALVVPKIEVDYFVDVPEPYYSKVFENAKFLSKAIHQATGCKRVGAIIAGWDVPHFHYHLIPMLSPADLDFARAIERSDEDNRVMQAKILSHLGG